MNGGGGNVRQIVLSDPAEEKLLLAEVASLGAVQGHARNWIGQITAITGVAAVLGFGFKAEALAGLDQTAKTVVVVAGLLAVIAAAIAVFFAALVATGGSPGLVTGSTIDERNEVTRQVRAAHRNMRISRGLTIVAVGLSAVGVGSALLGNREGIADKRWLLSVAGATPENGRVYCGELEPEPTTGALALVPSQWERPNGDASRAVPETPTPFPRQVVLDLKSLTETPNCQ